MSTPKISTACPSFRESSPNPAKNFPIIDLNDAIHIAVGKAWARERTTKHPYSYVAEDVLFITRRTWDTRMRIGGWTIEELERIVAWTQSLRLVETIALRFTIKISEGKQE